MNTLNQKLQEEMEIERMWLTSKQGEYIFFSALLVSLIVTFILWEQASHRLLLTWFFILTAINFLRWISTRYYYTHKEALNHNASRFKQILLIGCLFSGCWVAIGNIWFLGPTNSISLMTMSLFSVFVGVGAILSWFLYLPAVVAIILPGAGSVAALLFLRGDKVSMAWGLMFFFLSVIGIFGGLKRAKMLNHALQLSFENVALRQESEEKSILLETVLENMTQGISMSDKDDRLRMWNSMFVDLLGETGSRVAFNANLATILDATRPLANQVPQIADNTWAAKTDPANSALNGFSKTWSTYRLQSGQVYEIRQSELKQGGRVLTYTDITEQVKHVEALEKARKDAEQTNAAKTRFLAAASHDLRQPIHALGLFFAELSDQVRSPETEHVISQVEDSIESINSMLNALLDVSKLDAGIIKPNLQAFNLADLFERLSVEFRPLASEQGNELKFRPVSTTVMTDPEMLERMLRNLVGNALRYTKNGRILVAARIRNKQLEIRVIDTGLGIPADKLDEIFIEFHQLHNMARDRRQGLGLGLAIVKRLDNLLQHELKVVSKLGHGSCFSITLPMVSKSMATQFHPNKTAPSSLNNTLAGCRLLVLDDDVAVREGMQGLLTQWGCKVITASSYPEAIVYLEKEKLPIDLLIVDYRLPEPVSGIEAARLLQSRVGYPLGVLIITGDTGPERLREADASGFPLLHKPVQPAKLRSTLQYLISKANSAISSH